MNFNDVHRVERPYPENRWVGQKIIDPPERLQGEGPISRIGDLPAVLARAPQASTPALHASWMSW